MHTGNASFSFIFIRFLFGVIYTSCIVGIDVNPSFLLCGSHNEVKRAILFEVKRAILFNTKFPISAICLEPFFSIIINQYHNGIR